MTNVQTKIQKTSRGVYLAMNVLKYILILGLCLLVLVTIWFADACTGGAWGSAWEAFPSLLRRMVPVFPGETEQLPHFFMYLILQILYQGVMIAGVWVMAQLFRNISLEGTPFASGHIRRIKTVAWLTAALSFLGGLSENWEAALLAGSQPALISVNLTWLTFAGIIYCLALIFDYGCQLQQESDETL